MYIVYNNIRISLYSIKTGLSSVTSESIFLFLGCVFACVFACVWSGSVCVSVCVLCKCVCTYIHHAHECRVNICTWHMYTHKLCFHISSMCFSSNTSPCFWFIHNHVQICDINICIPRVYKMNSTLMLHVYIHEFEIRVSWPCLNNVTNRQRKKKERDKH